MSVSLSLFYICFLSVCLNLPFPYPLTLTQSPVFSLTYSLFLILIPLILVSFPFPLLHSHPPSHSLLSFPLPSLFSLTKKKNKYRTVIIYIVITVIPNEVPVGILLFRVRDVGAVVAAVAPRVKIGVLLQGVGD